MLSGMLRRVFCFFCICRSVSGSGLSIPTNSAKKLACCIMSSSSGSSARLMEASVENSNG